MVAKFSLRSAKLSFFEFESFITVDGAIVARGEKRSRKKLPAPRLRSRLLPRASAPRRESRRESHSAATPAKARRTLHQPVHGTTASACSKIVENPASIWASCRQSNWSRPCSHLIVREVFWPPCLAFAPVLLACEPFGDNALPGSCIQLSAVLQSPVR